MPRLTNLEYLKTHRQLREFWMTRLAVFANLSPKDQWYLHAYFQPVKDWSDADLLTHRKAVSKQRPSLPHQAGRALRHFLSAAAEPARVHAQAPSGKRAPRGKITIKAVVRPEIDFKLLARAVIGIREAEIRDQIAQTDAFIKELDEWIESELDQAS